MGEPFGSNTPSGMEPWNETNGQAFPPAAGVNWPNQDSKEKLADYEQLEQVLQSVVRRCLRSTPESTPSAAFGATDETRFQALERRLGTLETTVEALRATCKTLQSELQSEKQAKAALEEKLSKLQPSPNNTKAPPSSHPPHSIERSAFGKAAWEKFFGDVGKEPALPPNMLELLDQPCPFFDHKKIRNTHLLVLIPAKVDQEPFTLKVLEKLIASPKVSRAPKASFRTFSFEAQKQIGGQAVESSYWILMTREVLPNTSKKTFLEQKALVASHAKATGEAYRLPTALEAATTLLTHHVRHRERLWDEHTYTRCLDEIEVKSSQSNPSSNKKHSCHVGCFDANSSLQLAYGDQHNRSPAFQAACCRKL